MSDRLQISTRVFNSLPSSTVGIADTVTRLRESGEKVYDFSAARAFEPTPSYLIDEVIVEDPCFPSYKQLINYLGRVGKENKVCS